MTKEEFFEKIYNDQETNVIGGFATSITEKSEIHSVPLASILNLDSSKFSEEAKIIIDSLENDPDFPFFEEYQSLKWKIISLITIQDVFPGTIYSDFDQETWAARTYFYYEGLHLLREYFYCGFNNYLSASEHLLRTFIEFNIKQNYFDHICYQRNSYAPLKKYFKDGISPSGIKMANAYLPNGEFAKPIKKKIQLILGKLSSSSSHAYKPIDSNRGKGKLQHEYSMDTIYFWVTLNYTINIVLWSYYLMYPTLFKPREIIRKFGFNYPMGAFIETFQNASIKHSLSPQDYKTFEKYALDSEIISDLDAFYELQPDLTNEQILSSWTDENSLNDINSGYIYLVAKYRAINELLAVRCTFDLDTPNDEKLEKLMKDIVEYDWWKKNYKQF